jgi:hypothetical protein
MMMLTRHHASLRPSFVLSFSRSVTHSYFNALTGRTLDAFTAGYIPAMSPVANPIAAAIGNQMRL